MGLLDSKEFLALPDEEKVVQARSKLPDFDAYYRANPEGALKLLRKRTKKPETETSPVGNVIRQSLYGMGEAALDTVKLPFDAAEWAASKAGSDWQTGIDDSIEEYKRETLPDPETPEGRIARSTGYWAGIGLSTFAGGGALTGASKFAAAARMPKLSVRLGQAGKIVSGGANIEIGAGAAGGLAEGVVGEAMDDDDPMKPWVKVGAGVLAGLGGAAGIGIAARGASKRARLKAAGSQPNPSKGGGDLSPDAAALDAADDLRVVEQQQLMEAAEAGHVTGVSLDSFVDAEETSRKLMMDAFVDDAYGVLKPERFDNVIRGVEEVFKRTGHELTTDRTLISQIVDEINLGRMTREEADSILAKFGEDITSIQALSDPMAHTSKVSAQNLQKLSALSRRAKRDAFLNMSPEEQLIAKALGGPNVEGLGFWKRMENVRRGLLVTQVATAMRNMETQVANVGMHQLEDIFEDVLHRTFYGPEVQKLHPKNGYEMIVRVGEMLKPRNVLKTKSRSFNQSEAIENFFKREDLSSEDRAIMNPLFSNFSADVMINPSKDKLGVLEKATLWLNSANRMQEFAIRRAVFTANLERGLKAKGDDLATVIREGRIGELDRGDIKNAIGKALETTWGEQFHSSMDGYKGIAGSLINSINKVGVGPMQLTQVIPFPRFMANALKWQYHHSPLPAMKMLMSPKGWDDLAKGNVRPLIESTTGTGMFLAAYQLRDSEMAGERWYEVRPPEAVNRALGREPGSTLDTRAFNPFSSYLFVADVAKRMRDGSLNTLTAREVALGLGSINLRAGAGMYVLDQALDSIATAAQGLNAPEESFAQALEEGASGYMGAAWAGMLVPMQQLRDILSNFDEMLGTDNTTIRDTSESPFMGQILRKIPYGDEHLPPVELATRADAPRTAAPMHRWAGLTWRDPKNPVEKELDRLGFTRSNILPGSGNKEWDKTIAKHMGPIVESQLPAFINSRQYQAMDNEGRYVLLEDAVARARRAATKMAQREKPELAGKMRFARQKKSLRRLAHKRQRQAQERSERMRAIMEERAG